VGGKGSHTIVTISEVCISAIVLALAHCYQSRFSKPEQRLEYWKECASILYNSKNRFTELVEIVKKEQMDFLNRMEIPQGIAKNPALCENVFVLLVCILNRIPVFLVGKPGCSKSLSMQLIKSNLRGKDSQDKYFQTLPNLYIVSYQGSESSTSDGIIKVFQKAEKYLQANEKGNVLPVVLLDEVGLAEASKFNPLKVLHSLLEPATGKLPNIAVVGISNWSLDAAKMNRAIHLSRPDMDAIELFETGKFISSSILRPKLGGVLNLSKNHSSAIRNDTLRALADAYFDYQTTQRVKNLHGLRDYYSLIKYISRLSKNSDHEFCSEENVIQKGLMRNFGGLSNELKEIICLFLSYMSLQDSKMFQWTADEIIKENVEDQDARHLMLITNGDSALGILLKSLDTLKRNYTLIFGSKFDEDQIEDYSYRILNRIILCMENESVLVLKDLDTIYGSLYDMLNQNYCRVGMKNNCRIALGPYSNPMCQVNDKFRCIVLVDEQKVDYTDPPFLNRFEKQVLKFEDIINSDLTSLIDELTQWVVEFCNIPQYKFVLEQSFAGFNKDTIPSLVYQITNNQKQGHQSDLSLQLCKNALLWLVSPDAVLRLSKSMLAMKNPSEVGNIQREYLNLRVHEGLCLALRNIISDELDNHPPAFIRMHGIRVVVYTHSSIHIDLVRVLDSLNPLRVEKLSAFKSEKQMTKHLRMFFESNATLLVLQCQPHEDGQHIPLAKFQIEELQREFQDSDLPKHICILLHTERYRTYLDASSWRFSFLSGWQLMMIDNIEAPGEYPLPILLQSNAADLLQTKFRPINQSIRDNLLWAFSFTSSSYGERSFNEFSDLLKCISGSEQLVSCLSHRILDIIQIMHKDSYNLDIWDAERWQVKVALDIKLLYSATSFTEALKQYLTRSVTTPLANIVYKLESLSAWHSYHTSEEVWKDMFLNSDLFPLDKLEVPQGPGCFKINHMPLRLQCPFSQNFIEQLLKYEEMFKQDMERLTSSDSEIGTDDYLVLFAQYSVTFKGHLDQLFDLNVLPQFESEFISDISKIVTIGELLPEEDRHVIANWFISFKSYKHSVNDTVTQVTESLLCLWRYELLFQALLQLIAECRFILPKDLETILSQMKLKHKPDKEENISDTSNDFVFEAEGTTSENLEEICKKDMSPISNNEMLEIDTHHDGYKFEDNQSGLDSSDQLCNNESTEIEEESKMTEVENTGEFVLTEIKHDDNELEDNQSGLDLPDQLQNNESTEIEKECKTTEDENTGDFVLTEFKHDDNELEDNQSGLDLKHQFLNVESIKNEAECETMDIEEIENFILSRKVDDEEIETDEESIESCHTSPDPLISAEVDISDVQKDKCEEEYMDNETSDDDHPEETLVSNLCKRLIPSEKILSDCEGFDKWHMKVNLVLSFGCSVSCYPVILHALRIFNDLATILRHSSLDHSKIETYLIKLAESMDVDDIDNSVDSLDMFDIILELARKLREDGVSDEDAHQFASMYVLRSIGVNPESETINRFMELAATTSLPDRHLSHTEFLVRLVLLVAGSDITGDEQSLLGNLMKHIRNENDEVIQSSRQLSLLNSALCNVTVDNTVFLVVCIDALQNFVMNECSNSDRWNKLKLIESGGDDILSTFKAAVDILKGAETVSLKLAVAVAYLRTFLDHLAQIIVYDTDRNRCDEHQFLYQNVNAFLTGPIGIVIVAYLIKKLKVDRTVEGLKRLLRQIETKMTSFSQISFPDDDLCSSLEYRLFGSRIKRNTDLEMKLLQLNSDVKPVSEYLDMANNSEEGMYDLLQALAHTTYIPCTVRQLKDTEKQIGALLLKSKQFPEPFVSLVERLTGQKSFGVKMLQLTPESTHLQLQQSSVVIHIMSDVVARKKKTPLFWECLVQPTVLSMKDIRSTLQDSASLPADNTDYNIGSFTMCKCLFRMFLSECKDHCPICSIEWSNTDSVPCEQVFKKKTVDINDSGCQIIARSVVKLLLDACLISSVALNITSETDLSTKWEITLESLQTDFLVGWEWLANNLHLSKQHLGIYFHFIINHLDFSMMNENVNCQNPIEISKYLSFLELMVFDHMKNPSFLYDLKQYKDKISVCSDDVIKCQVLEISTNSADHIIPISLDLSDICNLFRVTSQKSVDGMKAEFYRNPVNEDKHPLIKAFFGMSEKLQLLNHIQPVIKWSCALQRIANHDFTRQYCQATEVNVLIKTPLEKYKPLKEYFDQFRESWEYIRAKLQILKEIDKSLNELPQIHLKTSIQTMIIENSESVIYKVLNALSQIQNAFLDELLIIAGTGKSSAVGFLRKSFSSVPAVNCVLLQNAKQNQVIAYDHRKLMDTVTIFSQNDPRFGLGTIVTYNFVKIEMELANELALGKVHLVMNHTFPLVTYANELFVKCATVLQEFKLLIPQASLGTAIKYGIEERRKNEPTYIDELMKKIEILLCLVKRTHGNPDQTIANYIQQWLVSLPGSISADLLPSVGEPLRLSHLVALYEFVENLQAEIVIDSLHDCYKVPLPNNVREEMRQFVDTNCIEISSVQIAFRRFVMRYLTSFDTHQDQLDLNATLIDWMVSPALWPTGVNENGTLTTTDQEESPKSLYSEFPKMLTLQHTYHALLCVNEMVQVRHFKLLHNKYTVFTILTKLKLLQ